MKITKLFTALVLTTLIYGCFDSPAEHMYSLMLNFKDSEGNDRIKGIKNNQFEAGGEDRSANIESGESFKMRADKLQCGHIKSRHHKYLTVRKEEDGSYFLFLEEASNPNCRVAESITFILFCPDIFGDHEEHIIASYWGKKKNHTECYRIEVDSKEFPVVIKTPTTWAWIVLDR